MTGCGGTGGAEPALGGLHVRGCQVRGGAGGTGVAERERLPGVPPVPTSGYIAGRAKRVPG